MNSSSFGTRRQDGTCTIDQYYANQAAHDAAVAARLPAVSEAERQLSQYQESNANPAQTGIDALLKEKQSLSWQNQGNCTDFPTDVLFPHDSRGVEAAKRICKGCVVKQQCLDYALENKIKYGTWGGTSERERDLILKQRRLEKNAKKLGKLAG